MKHSYVVAVAISLGTLTGCSQSAEPDAVGVDPFAEAGLVSFAPVDVSTPRTREEMEAAILSTQAAQEALGMALAGADPSDVQDVHRRVQQALSGLDGLARARGEQLAAATVLRVSLAPAPDTDETRAIAAVYAQYLVDRKSPQADLVLAGLDETGSAWTSAQRRHAATVAVEAAEQNQSLTSASEGRKQQRLGSRPAPVADAAVNRLASIAQS